MKKLALIAAVLMAGITSMASAVTFKHPASNQAVPASISYGGVYFSTANFTAIVTTVNHSADGAVGDYVVYGVEFSSGDCGGNNFVDVFDSTSTQSLNIAGQSTSFRWYNVNGSTNTSGVGPSSCSGFSGPPMPVRITRGLFFRPSTAAFNTIKLYWWKPTDE